MRRCAARRREGGPEARSTRNPGGGGPGRRGPRPSNESARPGIIRTWPCIERGRPCLRVPRTCAARAMRCAAGIRFTRAAIADSPASCVHHCPTALHQSNLFPPPLAPLSSFLTASPQPVPEAPPLHFLPPTLPPFSQSLALYFKFLHDFSYRSGHVLLLPSTLSSRARTCPIRSCYELMLLACQAAQTKASGVDYQSRSPCPARRGCTNGTGSSLGRGARALLPYTGVQRTAAPERLRSVRC